jgi:hypothetical protein
MSVVTLLRCAGGLAVAAVLLCPTAARAQMPTVTPDGKLADPAAPPPPPPSTHKPVGRQYPAGGATQAGGTGATAGAGTAAGGDVDSTGTGTGYYHTDDYGDLTGDGGVMEEADGPIQVHGGSVPPVHVVRKGDTLWDISWFYFSNAWEWPRVWSYNPEITNPHWIYPGDQVRLVSGGTLPVDGGGGGGGDEGGGGGDTGPDQAARPTAARTDEGFFELRQMAFVAEEDRKLAIEVAGSPEEKMLLSVGDEIYLSYPKGHPPKVGGRYAVYEETKRVKHPNGGDAGAYVKIVGEIEVISVKQDKNARAVILDSVEPIERGLKVGPVMRQFKNVESVAAKVDLEGTVVATLTADQLIGARQVVFVDRGGKEGVVVGNRMHVVRRGDAYEKVAGPKTGVGKNDQKYPARSIGEVVVVQIGAHSSIAVVTRSEREFGVGDRVLMTRGTGQR